MGLMVHINEPQANCEKHFKTWGKNKEKSLQRVVGRWSIITENQLVYATDSNHISIDYNRK